METVINQRRDLLPFVCPILGDVSVRPYPRSWIDDAIDAADAKEIEIANVVRD